jgi:hypothetical protein
MGHCRFGPYIIQFYNTESNNSVTLSPAPDLGQECRSKRDAEPVPRGILAGTRVLDKTKYDIIVLPAQRTYRRQRAATMSDNPLELTSILHCDAKALFRAARQGDAEAIRYFDEL